MTSSPGRGLYGAGDGPEPDPAAGHLRAGRRSARAGEPAARIPRRARASAAGQRSVPFIFIRVYRLRGDDALLVRSAAFTPGFSANVDLYDPNGRRLGSGTSSIPPPLTASGSYTAIVGARPRAPPAATPFPGNC